MRRDWFVRGAIVVVAAAFAVFYLMSAEGCDPASGVCFQTAWWSLPSLLVILGIGAGIMLFSIASTGRSGSHEATETNHGTEEEPSQDWTRTLDKLGAAIQATEKEFQSSQQDLRAGILSANESPTGEGDEMIGGRAGTGQIPRPLQPTQDVGMQNERLLPIEQRVDYAIRLSEELLVMEEDILASRKSLLDLEEQLRSELVVLEAEWDSLVTRDRWLLSAVRQLIGALGARRGTPNDEAITAAPLPPIIWKEPVGRESVPGVRSVGLGPVTRNHAVERMKKAAQGVKKARNHRWDMRNVHDMLNLALASFKAGDFEDAVRHSEEVLEIVHKAPSAL